MAVLRLALVIVINVLATACTGDSTPAAPTPPTATSLLISGDDAVRTGLFTNYTVTATLADGTTRAVTPTGRAATRALPVSTAPVALAAWPMARQF